MWKKIEEDWTVKFASFFRVFFFSALAGIPRHPLVYRYDCHRRHCADNSLYQLLAAVEGAWGSAPDEPYLLFIKQLSYATILFQPDRIQTLVQAGALLEKMPMKKKIIRVIIVIFLLGSMGTGIWYFLFKEPQVTENRLILYGNVDIRQVELAFNAVERIAEILVEEGEPVKKGQLLALLETRRLQQLENRAEAQLRAQQEEVDKLERGTRPEEIRKARAEVEVASTEAQNAKKTYQRLRPLSVTNLTSQKRTDDAGAKAEAARAQLNAARETLNLAIAGPRREDISMARARLEAIKAELDIARKNLEDARLTAPDHAVVQNRILQPGDMAFPQRPVFTLALTNPVWIRTYIPEPDMGKIFPGMKAQISTDSYPDKSYKGWIGAISPTAEFTPKSVETPEIRTDLVYQIRVYACNPQNEMRLGMPATVYISLDQPRDEAGNIPTCREE